MGASRDVLVPVSHDGRLLGNAPGEEEGHQLAGDQWRLGPAEPEEDVRHGLHLVQQPGRLGREQFRRAGVWPRLLRHYVESADWLGEQHRRWTIRPLPGL